MLYYRVCDSSSCFPKFLDVGLFFVWQESRDLFVVGLGFVSGFAKKLMRPWGNEMLPDGYVNLGFSCDMGMSAIFLGCRCCDWVHVF